jgi:hypothetical protein
MKTRQPIQQAFHTIASARLPTKPSKAVDRSGASSVDIGSTTNCLFCKLGNFIQSKPSKVKADMLGQSTDLLQAAALSLLSSTSQLLEIIEITFPAIYLIEQERSEPWHVLERYELFGEIENTLAARFST